MTQLLKSVSTIPLAFGGAAISGEGGGYGFGDVSESEARLLLEQAYDLGMRIFDTAPIYGFGLSEKRMGMTFKQMREKVFIVSKSGVTWGANKRVDMTNDPAIAISMLEQSLRDLASDYIDLYMIHWPDARVDIRRPMEALSKAKEQGKIKHIGLCNTNLSDLEKAFEIDRVEVVQSEFNFFQNEAAGLFPFLNKNNISFMSWGTLDKGILTGQVDERRKFDSSDCRSWAPWWKGSDKSLKYKTMKKMEPFLKEHGYSSLELALGFNLSFPEVSAAICGAKNPTQLESLFKALAHLPGKDILSEAQELAKASQK